MGMKHQRGKRRLGCLFTVLVLATVGYYGLEPGSMLFKTWQLREEMKAQAGFAPSIDNAAIRRRLNRKIENLGLPPAVRSNLEIRRTLRPREIIISTEIEMTYVLPFITRIDTLDIEVRSPV
jgi:hypothetical protein